MAIVKPVCYSIPSNSYDYSIMAPNHPTRDNLICLVVARGGSTSPPRKNCLPILGIPCVARVVRQIQEWRDSVPVVVSTDDDEIKDICRDAGALIIDRPTELASHDSEIKYTLLHACREMAKWGWNLDLVMLREGNTIVTDPGIFTRSTELLIRSGADSVLPIAKDDENDPLMFVECDEFGYIRSPFLTDCGFSGNRQLRPKFWRIWYGAECFRARNFERYDDSGAWWYMGRRVIGLSVPKTAAVHIDCQEDRQLAEYLLTRQTPAYGFPDSVRAEKPRDDV